MTSRKALSVSEMDACLADILWRLFNSCRDISTYAQNKLRLVGTQTYRLTLSRSHVLTNYFSHSKCFGPSVGFVTTYDDKAESVSSVSLP